MSNELAATPPTSEEPAHAPADDPAAPAADWTSGTLSPLLILAADDDALCTDDLCLPAGIRP
jgi:hypothetical protein